MLSRPFFKSEPQKPERPPAIQRSTPRRPRTPLQPPSITLSGWNPSTSTRLLSSSLAQDIWSALPERWQFSHDWHLVYSLEQHGSSLTTLYNNCDASKDSFAFYVLVVGDTIGGIFGAALTDPPAPSGRYFGKRESFLWKKQLGKDGKDGPFKAFMATGINDYVAFCRHESLSIGAGKDGKTGLWLNDRFDKGYSGRCDTFMNEPLSDDDGGSFEVLGVEVWQIPF
ncbi:TLD-domain-containing protein [Ascobolus immersus RN42]|uniref:Oxidation resistance protein 1 n=1 Tax=Ascobolus immersus RN42 TaxID=1160509 RepID=A0A3N4I6S1_ASCIM|nr:TLD-domain-containing protein [Ascobolus immersus RN42]